MIPPEVWFATVGRNRESGPLSLPVSEQTPVMHVSISNSFSFSLEFLMAQGLEKADAEHPPVSGESSASKRLAISHRVNKT